MELNYLMIEHALRFVDSFKLMEDDDGHYLLWFMEKDANGEKKCGPPVSQDWKNCGVFSKFLMTFYVATKKFSASKYVTSNIYFHEIMNVHGRLVKWSESPDSILNEMASRMKIKFDKYWDTLEKHNKLMYVVIVLDPRFKLKYVEYCFHKIYSDEIVKSIMTFIRNCLKKL